MQDPSNGRYESIPLAEMKVSKSNPRKFISEADLEELAASIKSIGIINPITVRPIVDGKKKFEIVSGERRFKAAKAAGLENVPVIVREISDEDVLEIQIIENLQRTDVHPLDEAEGFECLLKSGKYTKETLADRVGKSASFIIKRLQLTKLLDKAKEAFRNEKITWAHAVLLARLTEAQQKEMFKQLMNSIENWTTKDFKARIENTYFLKLADAAFDKEDSELVTNAGSCLTCPKRTGFNKNLFDDVEKDDICTDPQCFKLKVARHLEKKIEVYKESHKDVETGEAVEPKKIKMEYNYDAKKDKDFLYENSVKILGRDGVKKKNCDDTEDAIVVQEKKWETSSPRLGTMLKVCTNPKCKIHNPNQQRTSSAPKETPAQKAKREKEAFEREVTDRAEIKALQMVTAKVKLPPTQLTMDILRFGILTDISLDDILENNSISVQGTSPAQDEKNFQKLFEKKTIEEQFRLLIAAILTEERNDWNNKGKLGKELIKKNKIDLTKIKAAVRKELTVSKNKPKE